MVDSNPKEISHWIRKIFRESPERIILRTRHIEKERIWREILESDLRRVLECGTVHCIRSLDKTIFWRGRDESGRTLELQCALQTVDGRDTLIVEEAEVVRIGTAYDPNQDDVLVKKRWLAAHPEYEVADDGKIRIKVNVIKIK